MRNSWSEERMLEEAQAEEQPRGRNVDSSVDAQYEDLVVPDRGSERDRAS